MKRFALLIQSSQINGLSDLPGARADVENWKKFLTSEHGGKWENGEITVLSCPAQSLVSLYLSLNQDKYCFVAFSGHGYYDLKEDTTKICLNNREKSVDIKYIKPLCSKGTLIVDACRGIAKMIKGAEFSARADSSIEEGFIADSLAAAVWFNFLSKSTNGIITMYSCNVGESAVESSDDSDAGGYYSKGLVSSAYKWVKTAKYNSCYTTRTAHDDTTAYLKTISGAQNPEYVGNTAFPFAVKAS